VQHFTREELKSLLQAIPDDMNRLMVLVSFWHGLRASETVGLTGANIRDGYVHVKRLKGSLETHQPFVSHPDPLLNEKDKLDELAKKVALDQRLFPMSRFQFYRIVNKAGKKAGLPIHKCHPHTLKHSIAMQTIKNAGIENVRQWLGHRSISSSGEYLRVDDETAAKAIAAAAGSLSL